MERYVAFTCTILGVERFFVSEGTIGNFDPRSREIPDGVVAQCRDFTIATRISLALNFLEENGK